jgi:hypothetical protein
MDGFGGPSGPHPLSSAQERLWLLAQLQPEHAAYHALTALRIVGPLDVSALTRALAEIVRRHDALRTTFTDVDGVPAQMVAAFQGLAPTVEPFSGLHRTERDAIVARCIRAEAAEPFDLARGPLFRVRLLQLGDEEHLLLLGRHHIVTDGWSRGILFRELSVLYRAYRCGEESPLPKLRWQYADSAKRQREQLRSGALAHELAYWRAQLAGAPAVLPLPTDYPRPPVQTHRGARTCLELPSVLIDLLRGVARRERASLFMVLLAAFQAVLSQWSGSEDVVVGTPVAGRTCEQEEELIGFFANTLALRSDLSGDPSLRDLLRRARAVTLGAYQHQRLPFEYVVAQLRPARSLGHSPIFHVMLSLYPAVEAVPCLSGLHVEPMPAESDTTTFDLVLGCVTHPGGLTASLTYAIDLFTQDTSQRILRHVRRALEQFARDPDVRLSALGAVP